MMDKIYILAACISVNENRIYSNTQPSAPVSERQLKGFEVTVLHFTAQNNIRPHGYVKGYVKILYCHHFRQDSLSDQTGFCGSVSHSGD